MGNVHTELLYKAASVPSANTSLNLFFGAKDALMTSWGVGSAVMGGEVVAKSLVGEQAYYMEDV